jgi:hypothetical protein
MKTMSARWERDVTLGLPDEHVVWRGNHRTMVAVVVRGALRVVVC